MLEHLLTERTNPASENIHLLSTEQILQVINSEDRKVADAVAAALPQVARLVDAIVEKVELGGSLVYIGAGTSGRLGVLDASECPPTFSVPPTMVQGIIAGGEPALSRATEASEDDPVRGAEDLLARGFSSKDVLVGIAASGRTPYVLGALSKASHMGAVTGAISCTPDAETSRAVQFPIEVLVGPEVITGSTRMKAGTATKLVLNMISTGVMVRLGLVFGNLMVNLHPSNEKLKARAQRIVSIGGRVSEQRAAELLQEAGAVKTAIVMARKGVPLETARLMLEQAGGQIGKALDDGKTAG